ncbi:MAG TPA: hypothetical protein VEQ85_04375 [Lacipirellulaceae bacterium]|nr:hypothetical protein [Lacipirellulaceae bacterium]
MGIGGIGGGYQPQTTALQSGPTASQSVEDPARRQEEEAARQAQASQPTQSSPGQVTSVRGNNLNIVA